MPAAIEIENVSKSFKIYTEKYNSAKERLIHFGSSRAKGDFWALKDINLTINQGETIGLLGHNGSGKSTLLKCIAGILRPTTGEVRSAGRMAALLELGAGFHPDLTGRENVYQNASLLGLSKADIDQRFDDIVGFAGLEQFIDNQVKFYSSGMYVRLGFAVAINVDPEILLVDEVLAVGDEQFQRKCLDQVHTFQQEGRTIVVVTHAADLVRQFCHRAAALDHGVMFAEGEPGFVIREFRDRLMSGVSSIEQVDAKAATTELSPLWHKIRTGDITLEYVDQDRRYLLPGEPLRIHVPLKTDAPVTDVIAAIAIHDDEAKLVYSTNSDAAGVDIGTVDGEALVTFHFDDIPLLDGTFKVSVGIHSHGGLVYDQRGDVVKFQVTNPGREVGAVRLPMRVHVEHGAGSTSRPGPRP